MAPGIDDRLLLVPPGDVCVLAEGESGDGDDKLVNALPCKPIDPDDPLLDGAVSIGDSVLPLPMPLGDACFVGAEKAFGENGLEGPPPLLAGCADGALGVAMPCVSDDDAAEDEGRSIVPGLVAVLPFAFLLESVANVGRSPPARFLFLSPSPPPPLPWLPLPLPPLLPPALNIGPPEAPGTRMRRKTLAPAF